jgi:hypothetical protein
MERANGLRYPLVGGMRQRHFAGTSFKPNKLLENAQTPTSRVHAVLGAFLLRTTFSDYLTQLGDGEQGFSFMKHSVAVCANNG